MSCLWGITCFRVQCGINWHELIFQRLTKLHESVGQAQSGVFEKFTSAYLFQIARKKSCDYLLIKYVQKFQTNRRQFVLTLPYGVNTLRLQESNWSEHLSSCLYFVAWFCFWRYPLNFELRCCFTQQTCPPFCFLVNVFQGTCQSFLISTFCTNFVSLHSKNFNFLHCLELIDMLSANENAEIFVCILL